MIIDCTNGKLDEVRQFAKSISKEENLNNCINNLDYGKEEYQVSIYNDFAPKSFYFVREREGKMAGNGGIIFHGSHDNGGDGSYSTFSVSILNDLKPHWEIHT